MGDTKAFVSSDPKIDPVLLLTDKQGGDERQDEDNQKYIHTKYKPFARNDSYGVCGWHGPPFTALEYLRVTRRAVAVAAVIAVFVTVLLVSIIALGQHRTDKLMRWFLPHCQRVCSYAAGFEALRVVGYRKDNNNNNNNNNDDDELRRVHPEAPVLVCNHVSYLDVPFLSSAFYPSFIAKESVKKLPIWGRVSDLMRCIYVSHGSSSGSSSRTSRTAELISRIRLAAAAAKLAPNNDDDGANNKASPIVIFSEGTTTNNSDILPFRTGAFAAGLPVQPVLIQYHWTRFNPSWESISLTTHMVRLLAQPSHGCTITLLPPIPPPVELVEAIAAAAGGSSSQADTASDPKALAAVRQFADQTRTAIAEAGGLELSDLTYKDKQEYHAALRKLGYG